MGFNHFHAIVLLASETLKIWAVPLKQDSVT